MAHDDIPTIQRVRRRPGMYVPGTDGVGVLHMLLELLANSIDQHLAGHCSRAWIEIRGDGTITLEDDGPGLAGAGRPPLHDMLTQVSSQPTVDGHRPHLHLGVGGMGLCVVNALSERFAVRSVHDGILTTVAYSRGEIVEPLVSTSTTEPPGTRIQFRPDSMLFTAPRVSRVALARHLEDLTFLLPRFSLRWTVAGDDTAAGGLAARVAVGVPCDPHDVATHRATYSTSKGPIDVEVALAWRTYGEEPAIESFVNLARTGDHGSHADGLLAGVRAFGATTDKLVAAVSVVLADVKYGRPDMQRLDTAEGFEPVAEATKAALEDWAQRRSAQIRS